MSFFRKTEDFCPSPAHPGGSSQVSFHCGFKGGWTMSHACPLYPIFSVLPHPQAPKIYIFKPCSTHGISGPFAFCPEAAAVDGARFWCIHPTPRLSCGTSRGPHTHMPRRPDLGAASPRPHWPEAQRPVHTAPLPLSRGVRLHISEGPARPRAPVLQHCLPCPAGRRAVLNTHG